MPRDPVVTTSVLAVPRAVLWRHATSFAGIRAELWPWVAMTTPPAMRGPAGGAPMTTGGPLGRSVLLLGGWFPVEYDDVVVAQVEPGRRFVERSQTLTMARWEHERALEDVEPGACRVRDVVSFDLRAVPRSVPGAARAVRATVSALFAHRHRRLRARFGVPGAGAQTARGAGP
ncbi:hypothetical protein [Isoptericola halotolerans]|uniref:Ligand-binding SRPBCC domain-containing protein n=1 Tax=Isoptericola halotolerans TaxID=300560 RepID=A0ABX2A5B8_9MICO|nr:hypothetical protein [Isoptericola halotolerans]NOV98047.1 ligand-binding SRPBCC domain-containing protein [Isoptericola halotolerans]